MNECWVSSFILSLLYVFAVSDTILSEPCFESSQGQQSNEISIQRGNGTSGSSKSAIPGGPMIHSGVHVSGKDRVCYVIYSVRFLNLLGDWREGR